MFSPCIIHSLWKILILLDQSESLSEKQMHLSPEFLHLDYTHTHHCMKYQTSGTIVSTWQNHCSAGEHRALPKCKHLLNAVPEGMLLSVCLMMIWFWACVHVNDLLYVFFYFQTEEMEKNEYLCNL